MCSIRGDRTETGSYGRIAGGQDRIEVMLGDALRLLAARATHQGCEDGWYACPKSPDYIKHGDSDDSGCDCGADEVLAFFKKYGLPARTENVRDGEGQ